MSAKTALMTAGVILQVIGFTIFVVSYRRWAKRRKALLEMLQKQERL